MARRPGEDGMAQKGASTREDRLKAALKANMSRRKAQKRARSDEDATPDRPAPTPTAKTKED
ncbi:hypothetical protein [Jannaschia pohangensis]|uniref:Uncharacterized protein n=1 Tax=Jannaschia pohangensis TaxID=390807 RepID=A0A1I3IUK7_9RHOB|nr:hypothetical protein [Jannaschia pohangensis]SFI51629.1 hypothetical protein SAMN04488095_1104 [Jannaschia pohangensis]